jgi:hypothetical protein
VQGRLAPDISRLDIISPLRWTCKSRAKLTAPLTAQGWRVSSTTVGRLLHELGYRLQSVRKSREGTSHPDRNAQFDYINATAAAFLQRQHPVISVDTKKNELVGDFKNSGQEWQPSCPHGPSALSCASCRHAGGLPIVLEELSGVRKPPMITFMPTTARPQQRYDHRLRHLVHRTGDVTIATDLGVPRSTARGWLGAAPNVENRLSVRVEP